MRNIDKAKSSRRFYFSLRILCTISLIISIVSLIGIILYILINGVDKLSVQLLFGKYGAEPSILPAFLGTFELIIISTVIAVPIGIATAIFLVEYTNNKGRFVKVVQVATETLAGIPSIVYGLFGYLIFVVACKWGYSIMAGGLTLAIMILPNIVRSTEESLLAVPDGLREGAYALGTSKVRTIFKIVLPSASSGIVTSIILAVGRVISESAVLILTIGMVVNKVPESLLSPGTSLALDIYYFASQGYPDEAAATSVVLLLLVLVINIAASLVGKAFKKKTGDLQ